MSGLAGFDLGIFDEAHRTAGRQGSRFGFALRDKNLLIRKRLFLTATPRHYDIRHKNVEGDPTVVFSMDKPEMYGEQVYTLGFAEAVRRDIICNYKVLVSVVTTEMVTDELLNHGEVLVEGDVVRARQVAHQIAVQKGVETFGAKLIFTFHSSVKAAQSFCSPGPEGAATQPSPLVLGWIRPVTGPRWASMSWSPGQRLGILLLATALALCARVRRASGPSRNLGGGRPSVS